MYHATGRLPHLLPPAAYFDAGHYAREQSTLFEHAWRLVGTLAEIPRDGDFLTCTLSGVPVIVRRLKDEVRAFSNVCAHRHCLLKTEAHGHARQLDCPYHGWRYNDAGQVTRSRGEEHFRAPGAERPALKRYRTALCGQLIFVRLKDSGPSLRDYMGELYDVCAERFSDDYRQVLAMDLDYPTNWKGPIENSLESYHGPSVHPGSFGGDPGEERTTHVLRPERTEFITRIAAGNGRLVAVIFLAVERAILRLVGERQTTVYRHVHLFPNLTVSFTDGLSFVQSVDPHSPTTSRGLVRQFGLSRRAWPWWRRAAIAPLNRFKSALARRIVGEDAQLFPALQRGLEGSPHGGMLGRPEERIYAFQDWLVGALRATTLEEMRPTKRPEAPGREQTSFEPQH